MEKLIITVAPTGNVPTKEMTPYVPVTVDEIVEDLKRCKALGASIAHLHVRNNDQRPTSDHKIFKQLKDKIDEENIDMITQFSTGARGGENTIAFRGQMLQLKPLMASLATGSSNFPGSVNANSPELIKALAKEMLDGGVKPEIEVFDSAMIQYAKYLMKKGLLKKPVHFNLVMNVPGSIPGTVKHLMFLVDQLPEGATWTVSGIGKAQRDMITMAILLGGHVRTGLEDIIEYHGKQVSNADLVENVVTIAKALGREIATVEEAKEILNL